ncbi:MAG: hypothetical protein ABW321_15055 [Polyangiales bacterium]
MSNLTSRGLAACPRSRAHRPLFAGITLLLMAACGSDDNNGDPSPESGTVVEKSISPETGGTVELGDGSKLTIPPGSLPEGEPVVIRVAVVDDDQGPDGLVSRVWQFSPDGTEFETPVTIELPFDLDNRDARGFTIAWSKLGDNNTFEDISTTFEDGVARGQVRHFSLGAIRQKSTIIPTSCDPDTQNSIDNDDDGVIERCVCKAGFEASGSGCIDIDECDIGSDSCDERTNCLNLPGSFECSDCPTGFSGNGKDADGCLDIDECALDLAGCSEDVDCENTPGAFLCGDCPAGFTGGGAAGCLDIDECLTNNGGCDALVECLNAPGGFSCGACPSTHTGNGTDGCEPIAQALKSIKSFTLAGLPAVIDDDKGTITLSVPYKTTLESLKPTLEYVGQSITPDPSALQDFTKPVIYTIKAADGSIKKYTVNVTREAISNLKRITSFKIGDVEGIFGGVDGKTIDVTLPFGTLTLDGLVPEILHDGTVTSTNLVNGAIDFTEGVVQQFTVEAEDGSTEVYNVVVHIADDISKALKSFKLNGIEGIFGGADGKTISVTLPFGTLTLDGLVPEIIADGPVTSPGLENGVIDFVKGVAQEFTVHAGDGSEQTYQVVVNLADQASALIKQLKIGDVEGTFSGVQKQIITVVLPLGTSLLNLVPKIISEGEVIPPGGPGNPGTPGQPGTPGTPGQPGTPDLNQAISFLNGVAQKYLVKGADGTTDKLYDVVVKTAGPAANAIKQFDIGDVQGVFSGVQGEVITLVMPLGTVLTDLVPKIVSEGRVEGENLVNGVISFVNGRAQEITSTANDGTQRTYSVVVKLADDASTLIHELKIGDAPGVFSGLANDIITVTLPYATSLLNLVPTIVNDGSAELTGLVNGKISVVNGIANDLTVTANNGQKQLYQLVVKTASQVGASIESLELGGIPGVISGVANDVITVTVPFATSLLNTVPKIVSEGTVTATNFVNGKISWVNGQAQQLTVTAADGQQKIYEVTVNVASETDNLIRELSIGGVPGVFSGIANNIITVTLPYGTELQDLAPKIVSDAAVTGTNFINGKLEVVNGETQQLNVLSADGQTRVYDLIVKTAANDSTLIESFKIGDIEGVFSGVNNDTITAILPAGSSLLGLKPEILSGGAVSAEGFQNGLTDFLFGIPKVFKVTAPSGDTKDYNVIVKTALDSANSIRSFRIGDFEGVIGDDDVITTTLPFGAALTNIVPTIVSDGTVASPNLIDGAISFLSGQAQQFTVTAANGDTRTYTVIVNQATNAANSIQSMKLGDFEGVIDGDQIDFLLPFGTNLLNLQPTFINDGTLSADGLVNGLMSFISGEPQELAVEAANGAIKNYDVNVLTEPLSKANEITAFSLLGQPAEINHALNTITVAFPQHRDLSNVLPAPLGFLALTNGTGVTQTLGSRDFTKPVAFTAISRDGTPQVYPLTIINPPAP